MNTLKIQGIAIENTAKAVVYSSVVESMLMPRIIRLEQNHFCLSFPLMKLLPADFIIRKAEAQGLLKKGMKVIESSSGTFALGLAMVCALKGYELIIVGDHAIDQHLKVRLERLGAQVEQVGSSIDHGGIQKLRIERLKELMRKYPDHFWPQQYDNVDNPKSYEVIAGPLEDSLGQVDFLVGCVGTGGSMCGLGKYLRTSTPGLKIIGIDTHGSVLFGQTDRKRLFRGLGNSLMPGNIDHRAFDEIHWVTAAEGFLAARKLLEEQALYMGPTSGAAYMVGQWLARNHPDKVIVSIFPDEGHRYQDSVFDTKWLKENGVFQAELPHQPLVTTHPDAITDKWAYMMWHKRQLEEVMETRRVEPLV